MVAHSVSKRALKVTQLGPSEAQKSLMVRIDWTTAQIVKVTVCKDFLMPTVTMWFDRKAEAYKLVSVQDMQVRAGTTFYFAQSKEPGLYYLLKWDEVNQKFFCSCPAGRIHEHCHHMHLAQDHKEHQEELRNRMPVVSDRLEFDGEVRRVELANHDGISTDVVSLDPESGKIYGCTCDRQNCKHVQQFAKMQAAKECEAAAQAVLAEPISAEKGTKEYWKAVKARDERAQKAYTKKYQECRARLVELAQAS